MLAAVRQLKREYELDHFSWEANESDQTEAEQVAQDLEDHKLTAALNSELQENLNLVCCAVHTLQLAILDVVNKTDEDVKKLTEVAKKCQSVKFKSAFEIQGARHPPVWGVTRWGGIYEMISCFLQQRTFFEKLAEQFPEIDLSQSWTFAEHYEEAFRPLFLCTKKMEAANVSLSEFYLEWMIAIQKVKKLQSNPFSAPLVETLTSRLANLRGSRAFKMALYLDPRLNFAGSTLFSSDEKEEIQGYIVETWNRIKHLRSPTATTTTSEQDNSQCSLTEENENDLLLAELFGGGRMNPSMANGNNFNQQLKAIEVEPRCNFNFDVWKFWIDRKNTHPELSAVAAVVQATPSNQVSVERAFSALALVLTTIRSKLGQDTLSNILMIKLNKQIFEKVIGKLSKWNDNE
ncbi:uncharacterized protein LOC134291582 [Aedes albopictus]|uniref:HAT C-terminal dimerisation domain-containing protein n=1 Tax=Aedes albopictus TaxID=7160 RepID=A0ABM1XSU5_AEDAL